MRTIDELGISQHPWRVERITRQKEAVIKAADNTIVATMHADNARLIAAAPELYEALAAFVSWYDREKPLPYEDNGVQMIVHYAKMAIAKASGEERLRRQTHSPRMDLLKGQSL